MFDDDDPTHSVGNPSTDDRSFSNNNNTSYHQYPSDDNDDNCTFESIIVLVIGLRTSSLGHPLVRRERVVGPEARGAGAFTRAGVVRLSCEGGRVLELVVELWLPRGDGQSLTRANSHGDSR